MIRQTISRTNKKLNLNVSYNNNYTFNANLVFSNLNTATSKYNNNYIDKDQYYYNLNNKYNNIRYNNNKFRKHNKMSNLTEFNKDKHLCLDNLPEKSYSLTELGYEENEGVCNFGMT